MFSSSSNRFPTPRLCAYHPNSLAASAIATPHFFLLPLHRASPARVRLRRRPRQRRRPQRPRRAQRRRRRRVPRVPRRLPSRLRRSFTRGFAFASPISSPRTPRPASASRGAYRASVVVVRAPRRHFCPVPSFAFDSSRRRSPPSFAVVRRRPRVDASRVLCVRARAPERVDVVDRRGVRIVTPRRLPSRRLPTRWRRAPRACALALATCALGDGDVGRDRTRRERATRRRPRPRRRSRSPRRRC